jgi:outer membrane immunogenic protein
MNKLMIASVGMLALAAVQPAASADLKAPVYKATAPIAFSWSGCYFGTHIGGVWASKDWTDRTPGSTTFGQSYGSHDANGWLGGLQTGCNYQIGQIVFGIQADYAWVDADGSNANLIQVNQADHSHVKSLVSVTGRVGYAWDRFLGYVKGGGAWERDNYDFYVPATGATVSTASEQRRGGWTVGVGGEFAFTSNVTAFIEYDYYDFGTQSSTFVTVTSVVDRTADIQERKSVVKGGLNFKFDWSVPVIAKY